MRAEWKFGNGIDDLRNKVRQGEPRERGTENPRLALPPLGRQLGSAPSSAVAGEPSGLRFADLVRCRRDRARQYKPVAFKGKRGRA